MLVLALIVASTALSQAPSADDGSTLEERLKGESVAVLSADAKRLGNASRGAIAFHQAHLACTRCHEGEAGKTPFGPNLALLGKAVTDEYLIRSILEPSHEIKKGFETVKVALKSGRTVTGLLVEENAGRITLRDLADASGALVSVAKREVDERSDHGPSSMPTGLVNGLRSRESFLDLVTYLRAIADGGPERAKALKPAASLLAPPALPDYERDLDHAGLIADSQADRESFARGEAIYRRVCANCHGTKDAVGSMPTSLRFASGTFKNGADPYAMYKTLTQGVGQMPAQPWMVPRQKYDVIRYVRDAYVKPFNPTQDRPVTPTYLAGLPKGKSHGPQASTVEPWSQMNYGSTLSATYEIGDKGTNFAHKGVAVRLDPGRGGVSQGRAWAVYDHDTMRLAAAWSGPGFIDWEGINFNGTHAVHPRVVGQVEFETPVGPGWADPVTGSFADPRLQGRDGRPYGPMPRTWLKYRGLYRQGDRAILAYRVGNVEVLDSPGLEKDPSLPTLLIVSRTIEVAPSTRELTAVVADGRAFVAIAGPASTTARIVRDANRTRLTIPASTTPTRVKVLIARDHPRFLERFADGLPAAERLSSLIQAGGPAQWPEVLETLAVEGSKGGPFDVDILAHPVVTPWHSQMRFTGLDFLPDGKGLVVCDWDGDVWRVSGIDRADGRLSWKRIASGLFQPLGLKVVEGVIYVGCRDQIVILRDTNGDGETDFYECFNDDHQVTEHFHEFAMDLQVDGAGNFYYAKGARHALKAVVPQHGTLLRVSKDGSRTEILANGFRAPNGVLVNPDGTFYVTDQEGHWTPKNRVNWVRPGRFYGNLWGFTDVTDRSDGAMEPPICWITNAFDRSPAQVLRVEGKRWGPLAGRLITLSYGYGKVFLLLEETVGDQKQGGLVALPIPQFPTGLIRGRFHPETADLYACGMFAWAGDRQQPGGLYRIKRTNKPLNVPLELKATSTGVMLTFSEPLDPSSSADPERYKVKTWGLNRSEQYGSKHVDETDRRVTKATLSADRKTIRLEIKGLKPTRGMSIDYTLKAFDGASAVEGSIHNTIHELPSTP